PAHCKMMAGDNEIRANFIGLDAQPTPTQCRENTEGHGSLAHSAVGTGNHESCHLIPPLAKPPLDQGFFPRYDSCATTVGDAIFPTKTLIFLRGWRNWQTR